MKQLIKPTFAMSFVLLLTGLVPSVQWYMPLFGLISLAFSGILGVLVLGSEDRDYLSQLELVRIEHSKLKTLLDIEAHKFESQVKQIEELQTRVSKAIAENRELAGRLQ